MPNQRILLYRGQIIDLGLEQTSLPNGQQINLEIVRHPGGAVIAAVDDKQQICLLHQYRHAAGGFIWEVPAGKLDPGESPLATAQRELAEEAGVCASHWTELGAIYSTPGFCDEILHLYLARNLTSTSRAPQPEEYLESYWFPLTKAFEWAYNGKIKDAKTLVILFRAAAILGQPQAEEITLPHQ
ncbi:NUDIX hydrolase [Nitrosococcus watsonii]|uniref:GDP-mannose pyrophosphatase n=1 Tax=Nitrosococcus watsoni (strain C-113) TaxID=105559 RepID=D8KB44_NITWC|nr:NUDIX hydrolase [Nitrosococcus watsonii]ADJ27578.1 NUDIX hydrolase [Nitrosococcus watsonii C-113]